MQSKLCMNFVLQIANCGANWAQFVEQIPPHHITVSHVHSARKFEILHSITI